MAATHSIRIPFRERDLDQQIREHYAEGSELFIYDKGHEKSVPGLVLWINGKGVQQFQLLKKISGPLGSNKKYRRNIGPRSIFSVTRAREDAADLIRSLKGGQDPKVDAQQDAVRKSAASITLREALEGLLSSKGQRDTTAAKYRRALKGTFRGYADRPLTDLTEEKVKEIHRKRSKISEAIADHDCRVVRAAWIHAAQKIKKQAKEDLLGPHPVGILNKKKDGWNRVARRQTTIPVNRLADWFSAIDRIRMDPATTRIRLTGLDLLEALTVSGFRLNELATLTWDRVDQAQQTIKIDAETSKTGEPFDRPITRHLGAILDRRHKLKTDGYVFPNRTTGVSKPISSPRSALERIERIIGIRVIPHDLRRVWSSAAARAGLPLIATKLLMNHSLGADVTLGYQVPGIDELRIEAQRVEDQILTDAGLLRSRADDLLQVLQALPEEEREKLLQQLQEGRT